MRFFCATRILYNVKGKQLDCAMSMNSPRTMLVIYHAFIIFTRNIAERQVLTMNWSELF